ncbi:MAG: phosphoribosylanthranilate isomerase [Candidatus Methanomethylophilaceae archaeon]
MTRVKICGLRREVDIDYVNAAHPDYAGFVFAEGRRQISHGTARELRSLLDRTIIPVGVFADSPIDEIVGIVRNGTIDAIQLHGKESSEYISKLKAVSSVPVIQAVNMNEEGMFGIPDTDADMLLLDGGTGGTGTSFDWSSVRGIRKDFFLAGGLNMYNVRKAIDLVRPYAVDISSGVEINGRKDGDLIKDTIRRVRDV